MFTGVPTDVADGAVALPPHAAMLTTKRTISGTRMSNVCRRSRFCSGAVPPQRESLLFCGMTVESQASCHRHARGPRRLHYDRVMADSVSSLTSRFAPIPGGGFIMGTERGQEDERPPHRVVVDGFELGVFPLTRAEYERFVEATRHEPP